jgi:hypothetical protein
VPPCWKLGTPSPPGLGALKNWVRRVAFIRKAHGGNWKKRRTVGNDKPSTHYLAACTLVPTGHRLQDSELGTYIHSRYLGSRQLGGQLGGPQGGQQKGAHYHVVTVQGVHFYPPSSLQGSTIHRV